jgi:hypothetical protein
MAKAYKGLLKAGTQTYQTLLGGLAGYGALRGAVAAGSEIYTAGRGLYMAAAPIVGAAAEAAGAAAPIAGAALLAV